ncbi:MAG TPA: urocanate hydratase, partial [Myxococcales bacterium]|nr:urocanate hydratase [Myxococcales bacterium]
MAKTVRAARGTSLSCKGWVQEAALRMLQNNLDPEVAENPAELVVYGGNGKAARDWPSFERICSTLQSLTDDETLLVQSGKPVGVLRTHPDAPRVLLANSNLVPKWGTWEKFRELEKQGLIMYGQMTAGSWIYIGTQGILQGTYETFASAGRLHFGSPDLAGRLVVSAGLGGMGGAQPLAAAMCGATFLGIEVDEAKAKRRVEHEYLDELAPNLDEALKRVDECLAKGEGHSIGVVGNAAEILPELLRRGLKPDLVTDQTSAHDPLNGYIPIGLSMQTAAELRAKDPVEYQKRSIASMAKHVEAMLEFRRRGSHV